MKIKLHPHAEARLGERGATESEVRETVEHGENFSAKFGRSGFRKNFAFGKSWLDKVYAVKQVEVFAVKEEGVWLVITVITRFF